jgi:hypothetical protein
VGGEEKEKNEEGSGNKWQDRMRNEEMGSYGGNEGEGREE